VARIATVVFDPGTSLADLRDWVIERGYLHRPRPIGQREELAEREHGAALVRRRDGRRWRRSARTASSRRLIKLVW
jgi:hypothetical protein